MYQKKQTIIIAAILIALPTLLQAESQIGDSKVDFSGSVEADIFSNNSDTSGNSSNIVVSTVEFGIKATLSDKISASITLLAEDIGSSAGVNADAGKVAIDEAVIQLELGSGSLSIGQMYIPFGSYESHFVTDPLTLLLGESSETAVMYSTEIGGGLDASFYLFNGDVDETGTDNDKINDIGFSIKGGQENWSIGIDYVSNIADSDELSGLGVSLLSNVAGAGLHGSIAIGDITVFGEYITAIDDFTAGDLGGAVTTRQQPSAFSIEVALALSGDSSFAIGLSTSDDANGLLPYESQLALAYSTTLVEHIGMTVELLNAEEYNNNKDTIATLQLAAEF